MLNQTLKIFAETRQLPGRVTPVGDATLGEISQQNQCPRVAKIRAFLILAITRLDDKMASILRAHAIEMRSVI
jgi:hypothetical protein